MLKDKLETDMCIFREKVRPVQTPSFISNLTREMKNRPPMVQIRLKREIDKQQPATMNEARKISDILYQILS